MKPGLDPETEKRIEKLGCRERLIKAYRKRQRVRGQLHAEGERHGVKKTIEESVMEWREAHALLGD